MVVSYNLTLHDNYNKRILGFDNAHAVQTGKKYKGRVIKYDHMHKNHLDKGTPYEFVDAHQLLNDFFTQVNRIMKEIKEL